MDGYTTEHTGRAEEPGARPRAPGRLETVQLFLNTRNIEAGTDVLDRPEIADQWLLDHGLSDRAGAVTDADDLKRLLELREAFRGLLASRHDAVAPSDAVKDTVAAAAEHGLLSVDVDDRGYLSIGSRASSVDLAMAKIVLIATEASTARSWDRLKVCTNDACRWAFWDASRNRSGRWCTMSLCGNQAKVRAHRQRRRR